MFALLLVAGLPALAGAADLADAPDPQPTQPGCADAPSDRFTDVSGTHAVGIDCIGWWGVTQGVGDRQYSPSGDVQRDQMASFIARTLALTGGSLPESPADAFTDDTGNTHELAIDQLAALEVIGGISVTLYAPEQKVTRAQMAAFLARAWEARVGAPLPASADYFEDDDGSIHEANINRVAEAGFTGGTTSGRYDPDAFVSRAQMGTFLARFLSKLVADGHISYPPTSPVPIPEPEPTPAPTPDIDPKLTDSPPLTPPYGAVLTNTRTLGSDIRVWTYSYTLKVQDPRPVCESIAAEMNSEGLWEHIDSCTTERFIVSGFHLADDWAVYVQYDTGTLQIRMEV